jgi:SAM-dependent methyltransferase
MISQGAEMIADIVKKIVPAWLKQALYQRRRKNLARRFPGLREGQIDHLMYLRSHVDLRNARVLEIGGDEEILFAQALRYLGAASVLSTNITAGFASRPACPGIERREMDVRKMDVPEQGYDLVIGIALLEHLGDMPVALKNIFRATRPGGYIYFHGGPVWNCSKGHHLWADGADGREYRFNGDNPVPDWGHLCKDEAAMSQLLIGAGYSQGDVQSMVDWIYHSPQINRMTAVEIARCFEESPFRLLARTEDRGHEPGGDTAAELTNLYGHPLSEYAVSSISFLAERPA